MAKTKALCKRNNDNKLSLKKIFILFKIARKIALSDAIKIVSNTHYFTLAESLGGVESLVCVPYDMTHGSIPDKTKEDMGLTKDLVRLSVGIEDVEDLYADIINSLNE